MRLSIDLCNMNRIETIAVKDIITENAMEVVLVHKSKPVDPILHVSNSVINNYFIGLQYNLTVSTIHTTLI